MGFLVGCDLLSNGMKDYSGFLGTAPDPMQATLQRGPILSADPEFYIAIFEAAGRKDQAVDDKRRSDTFLKHHRIFPDHEKPKNTKFNRFSLDTNDVQQGLTLFRLNYLQGSSQCG